MHRVFCTPTFRQLTKARGVHDLWPACFYHSGEGVYGHRPKKETDGCISIDETVRQNRARHSNLFRLVSAYREHGHKVANTDPLKLRRVCPVPELDPRVYELSPESQELYDVRGIVNMGKTQATLPEIVKALDTLYTGSLSAELHHLRTEQEKQWFATNFEQVQQETIPATEKISIAKLMLRSQEFDHFLANKFTTVKRYAGEGAESAMAFYEELFKQAAHDGIDDVVVCIAHRGRLNLLSCLLNFPPVIMFKKMKGLREFPPDVAGSGDILMHLTSSVDLKYDDKSVHVTMLPNPSHLEAANPVCVGKARSRMQSLQVGDYAPDGVEGRHGDKVLCFQIHGDGAFSAQGVVSEMFALADTPHFSVGGSVHLIVNNQIAFTTESERGRSSLYTSCIAKVNACPIIRVNGDYPEDVIRACRLAMRYRQEFRRDVVVDYICFRRWGHNELDEPMFTQPRMYRAITSRKSIPDCYADSIMANHLEKQWAGLVQPSPHISSWDTGVPLDVLKFVGAKSVTTPSDLKVHPSLMKNHISKRLRKLEEGLDLDWATAEAMAFGSLLFQGFNVRISGQDVGRGTFSHRHVMLVDQETDALFVPLNDIAPDQKGKLEVVNSALSEEAVLGFEYGVSVESPKTLAIWEAQFGDFFNGAQVIIDTFLSGGETKWLLQSSLTVLLPHGMDGAGPEHSSARMERFLQLCDSKEDGIDGDNVNFQIANPTSPSQYFHLLRRQMVRNYRKPLVCITPKGLLRHPSVVSALSDLTPGTTFKPVLGDPTVDPGQVTKVVFVTGKQFYTLSAERETRSARDTALIRLEVFCGRTKILMKDHPPLCDCFRLPGGVVMQEEDHCGKMLGKLLVDPYRDMLRKSDDESLPGMQLLWDHGIWRGDLLKRCTSSLFPKKNVQAMALCPFPADEVRHELKKFPKAKDFVWSQEEHRNHGAWSFVAPRFENVVGHKLRYVGRDVHATPATGVGQVHKQESQQIVEAVFS